MKIKTLIESTKQIDLSSVMNDDLRRLDKLFQSKGFELRIVGGAVRDILSGKEPKDIDLASDANPQEVVNLLKSENIRVIETGLQHGTVTANMNDEDYEFTTLRIDKETDGRHAEVEYTRDWEIDAERRDLTFNAMSMDFEGNLYDYHGGHDDLNSGTAKFVGNADKRMQEDYLRILRYFRFQGRMESPNFDEHTLDAIAANSEGLKRISGERIWSEMGKILSGNNLNKVMSQMKKTGVLDVIGIDGPNRELLRVKGNTDDKNLLLASLLNSESDLDVLRSKWKFSNPEYSVMKFIIRNRGKNYSLSDIKKMVSVDRVPREMVEKLMEYEGRTEVLGQLQKWTTPEFPINGNDLKGVGISPGPEMGETLSILRNKWAQSGYKLSKEELLSGLQ
jgi:tRNA nucleotidyltransferase (CCA-adding enzyme)